MFGGDGAELDTIDYPYPAWMTAFVGRLCNAPHRAVQPRGPL